MKPVAALTGALAGLLAFAVVVVTLSSLTPLVGGVASGLAVLPAGVGGAVGVGLFVADFLSHRLEEPPERPTRTAAVALLVGSATYAAVGGVAGVVLGSLAVPGAGTLVVAAGAGLIAATVAGVLTVVRLGGVGGTTLGALLRTGVALVAGAVVGAGVLFGVTAAFDPYVWPSALVGIPAGLLAGVPAGVAAFVVLGRRGRRPIPTSA
jgi:hypothetical protein